MLKKKNNDISDDDFICEKQICHGSNKSILTVESIHSLKGIDKNIKKKIEEGKVYLNDISPLKNAEIEEAFLKSLSCNIINNDKNNEKDNLKRNNILEQDNINNEKKYHDINSYNFNYDNRKKDKNKDSDDNLKNYECSYSFIRSTGKNNIYSKYNIYELPNILEKRTMAYIKRKKRKLEKKRLYANLEALRLQYIPINNDKFQNIPRDVKENILALFACIIIKHIDSFEDIEMQNHLNDLSKNFLKQLSELLSIDALAFRSIIKPLEQGNQIRNLTGDKNLYELYEKPFVDNILCKIADLQSDIDYKFKKVVEELNNEMDFWQDDENDKNGEQHHDEKKDDDDNNNNNNEKKDYNNEKKDYNNEKKDKNEKDTYEKNKNEKDKYEKNKNEDYYKDLINTISEKNSDINEEYEEKKERKNIKIIDINKENETELNEIEAYKKELKDEHNSDKYYKNGEENNETLSYKSTGKSNENNQILFETTKDYFSLKHCKNTNDSILYEDCELNFKKNDVEMDRQSTGQGQRYYLDMDYDSFSDLSNDLTEQKKNTKKKEYIDDSDNSYIDSDIERELKHNIPTKCANIKSVILRDLITNYIMTGNNNARIQLYFQQLAKLLKINELLILRIEENLAADLINALQASINETSKKKKNQAI